MLKDFTNRGLGQWPYFLIHIVLATVVITTVDRPGNNFLWYVLAIVVVYILSLKRVNDTKFVGIHRGYKYLIALFCSVPFFSLPFALILALFRSQYEKPFTAFEEKYAESEFLKKLININQTIGIFSILLWVPTLLGSVVMCGSGDCSSLESVVQLSLLWYPLIAIFTIVMTKWIKFRTKIPAAIISFLYWWFIFFLAFLLIYIME